MKVLVLGATGMLGYEMFRVLCAKGVDVYCTARNVKSLRERMSDDKGKRILLLHDAKNYDELKKLIISSGPDFVINCIGIIKQSDLSKNYLESISINSLLPHQIAEICGTINCGLIHISTDCVFLGDRGNYKEDDPSDANDLYGKSKYLGEVGYGNSITLRTSIIGHEIAEKKYGLLEWFLSQEGRTSGYTGAFFSGVTTLELSRIVSDYIIGKELEPGVYQVAAERISKYDLLKIINSVYGKNCIINPSTDVVIDRSLNGGKLHAATGYRAPGWKEMIQDMHDDYSSGY